ncbi:hypothetical protein BGZ61DRAFT_356857 [Ilyonectria robusta]|uniref:uncharacterized protein n=1 Tax=Ilyonectria robusta TaxID=1079257 RepID=UPI001E8DA373|nr:uncharacterized protein BGZ61DRAFT_356857 [Ilyonectria robusta]KAH8683948.1 hypothetical protein BGZ61DRAFT_356857 [Ilyonectria robusta]
MHKPIAPRALQHGYRGRVRSGCLTCRSRKVKCDEARPICNNCTRLQLQCTYKPRRAQQALASPLNPSSTTPGQSSCVNGTAQSPGPQHDSGVHPSPPFEDADGLNAGPEAPSSCSASQEPFQYPDISIVDVTSRLEKALQGRRENPWTPDDSQAEADSPATLISRDIELTTTMDLLAARGKPLQLSSAFFLETIDCPGITPFDSVNWQIMKHCVVELGGSCEVISSAITAVSALYKAQLYSLSVARALSLYRYAKDAVQEHLNNDSHDFGSTLVATFLLCLFELIHSGEITPTLKEPSELFLKGLRDWAHYPSTHSELFIRLIAWFKIINRITLRGGGMGLISDSVYSLFPDYDGAIPNIKPPASFHSDLSSHLYQELSAPIFNYYYRLQILSGEIAQLTHYHRSRTTGMDQEEVVREIAAIKSRLHDLWHSRCAIQSQTRESLRSQLAPKIANPIISLIGICDAAYHAEIVEIDRVLGDPVSKWTDSRESIQAIRDIVDGDGTNDEGADAGKLNPGYLRPLFLYAIECMDQEQNQWAVERIAQIQSPIYRSDFFAAFGKELSDAQARKERRVTSKYFCVWYFGVPPPFM